MPDPKRSCLIRGGTVVSPSGSHLADVLVVDGTIERVERGIALEGEHADVDVIDATGRHVLPGVIDPQVHLRDPGYPAAEDFASGTRAAAAGGVTTVFDMPNTNPTTTTLDALERKREVCAAKACVNWGLFFGVTGTPENLRDCARVANVPGLKVFMAQSTGPLLVDDQTRLEALFAETDPARVIAVHAEDQTRIDARMAELGPTADPAMHAVIRDAEACVIATKRAIALAEKHRHRLHVLHVSTAAEVELFDEAAPDPAHDAAPDAADTSAEAAGAAASAKLVTSETTPNHLLLDDRDYPALGNAMRMNPSIKSPADRAGLWRGLHERRIDLIATDHAPHPLPKKARGYWQAPSGMPSIENSLALLLNEVGASHREADATGRRQPTIEDIVAWMCAAPARVYGLWRKGVIAAGMDADISIVDMSHSRTIADANQLTRCGWSPYAGRTLTGWPMVTLVGGHRVFERDAASGAGRDVADFDDDFRAPEVSLY